MPFWDCQDSPEMNGGKVLSEVNQRTHGPTVGYDPSKRRRYFYRFLLLSILFGLVYCWRSFPWGSASEDLRRNIVLPDALDGGSHDFDWNAHEASKMLNWTECYDDFQCARLIVPLLYSEPSGDEAVIALVKSPSKYPPGHEKYRGPILFNPGGPGESGIGLVLSLAPAFRTILSDQFDLVGFDPRGVSFTTPKLSVFKDRVEGSKYYSQFPTHVNLWPSTLGDAFARARVLANLVEDRARFVAEHMSTPIVARDMLSIVHAFGQDNLQYWGFSYGSVLGATFAAMFPDRVGRIILDGVLDMEDYYNGSWANNLRDTDAALTDIYTACVAAGPSKCPIYENSTAQIHARVDRVLDSLKTTPLAYYDQSSGSYEILDYSLARNVIFTTLYRTHSKGARLTQALAALEQGDPSELYMLSFRRLFNELFNCDCPICGGEPTPFPGSYELTYAIQCGDAVDRFETLETLREAYEEMENMSSFAANWPMRVFCSAWNLHGRERFNGSFEQTTGHPLLLIGNRADPVTPIWNAHKLARSFKDSVVLTQNSSGHCSVCSSTSICTSRAVREYFINGTLPEEGAICETESSIFGDKVFSLDSYSEEEKELVKASEMIHESNFVKRLGTGLAGIL